MSAEQENVSQCHCGQSLLIRALHAKIKEAWAQNPAFIFAIAHFDHLNHPVAEGFPTERALNRYVDEHNIDLNDINVVIETSRPQALAS